MLANMIAMYFAAAMAPSEYVIETGLDGEMSWKNTPNWGCGQITECDRIIVLDWNKTEEAAKFCMGSLTMYQASPPPTP